jgi:CRP-like cAMP-binding protein
MTSRGGTHTNLLLNSLPPDEWARIRPLLKPILLRRNAILLKPGDEGRSVVFPFGGVVSLITTMADGNGIEIASIGREGFLGMLALFRLGAYPFEASVTVGTPGVQIEVEALRNLLRDMPVLYDHLTKSFIAVFGQASRRLACTAWPPVEARCAFRLLTIQDLLASDVLPVTQETISRLIGVRRPGVSSVASMLQRKGLIAQARGRITILDRGGLETIACDCHREICEIYNKLNWYSARTGALAGSRSCSSDAPRSEA